MDAETQHPTWIIRAEKLFSGEQVVERQKPAYHQEYCSDICGGCVRCLVSSVLLVYYIGLYYEVETNWKLLHKKGARFLLRWYNPSFSCFWESGDFAQPAVCCCLHAWRQSRTLGGASCFANGFLDHAVMSCGITLLAWRQLGAGTCNHYQHYLHTYTFLVLQAAVGSFQWDSYAQKRSTYMDKHQHTYKAYL